MKKFLLMFTVLGLTLSLSSKVFAKTFTTEKDVAANTTITVDNFTKTTTYVFPVVNYNDVSKDEKLQYMPDYKNPDGFMAYNPIVYYMKATSDSKNNKQIFNWTFTFVSDYDVNNRWVASAIYDSNGNALFSMTEAEIEARREALINDENQSNLLYVYEGITKVAKYTSDNKMVVSREYLEAAKDSGLVLRATVLRTNSADPEYRFFHIPSYYIQAILDTVK